MGEGYTFFCCLQKVFSYRTVTLMREKEPVAEKKSGNVTVPASLKVGFAEATLLHPLTTLIKRLHVRPAGEPVFAGAVTVAEKGRFLCRGIQYAGPNKIMSRWIVMGCQPLVNEYLQGQYGVGLKAAIGERYQYWVMHTAAGFLSSIPATIATMPLDTLKSMRQTGSSTHNIRTVLANSYRSMLPTLGRNASGMAALYGGSALMRQALTGDSRGQGATSLQETASCLSGGILGAFFANPFDVVKTQVQVSGRTVGEVVGNLRPKDLCRGILPGTLKGCQRGAAMLFVQLAKKMEKETSSEEDMGVPVQPVHKVG